MLSHPCLTGEEHISRALEPSVVTNVISNINHLTCHGHDNVSVPRPREHQVIAGATCPPPSSLPQRVRRELVFSPSWGNRSSPRLFHSAYGKGLSLLQAGVTCPPPSLPQRVRRGLVPSPSRGNMSSPRLFHSAYGEGSSLLLAGVTCPPPVSSTARTARARPFSKPG